MRTLSPKTIAITVLVILSFMASGYAAYQHRKFKTWLHDGEQIIRMQPKLHSKANELPPLMQQYIKKVHAQPQTRVVEFTQSGLFWMNPTSKGMRFEANQVVGTSDFNFSWFADILLGPVSIYVCDRLIAGNADLKASLFGSLPLANESGPALLRGELLRYLAEIPWSPSIVLNNYNLEWKTISSNSVEVSTAVDGNVVSLEFYFDKNGLIERTYSKDREYTVRGHSEKRPWEGRFSNYTFHDGVLIPAHGEVSWILDTGKFTYFKGDIVSYRNTQ